MSKVGEGDSRWIVSRRSDGKNVDNWHWTEKDLFPWCQNQFELLFKDVTIPSAKADLKIDKIESVTGSMLVCNRKGKTFYVFDVQLKLDWSGKLHEKNGTEEEVTGKGSIHVEEIANDEDKWKWKVNLENETPVNRTLKEEVHANVGKILDTIINNVLEEMKGNNPIQYQEASAAAASAAAAKSTETLAKPVEQKSKIVQSVTTSSSQDTKPSKPSTKTFTQKLTFEVPPHILYETLLDPNRVAAFTGGPCKVDNKVGSEFFLFDGAVQGTQVELIPSKKIVQKWRFKTWPENHYSTVTFSFDNDGSATLLTLSQKEIPSSDYDRTCDGWDTFFWQRIRGLFGWSYKLK